MSLSTVSSFALLQNTSIALKKVWAQRGFGKPKIPLEIAGMDTDLHLSLFANLSVFRTAACNKSTLTLGAT